MFALALGRVKTFLELAGPENSVKPFPVPPLAAGMVETHRGAPVPPEVNIWPVVPAALNKVVLGAD